MKGQAGTADCVVVGAGVVGLSVAYHLACRGVTDVVVLEKESLPGTGSTGRCAGGFRHQFSTTANVRLSQLSIEKLSRFEEELGHRIDFHQDGYLFLLTREPDVAAFERNVELQRSIGVPVERLAPGDIPRVLPDTAIETGDVLAATYCPTDGLSDPGGVTEGYRAAATRAGVEIATDEEAVAIDVAGGSVRGVRTPRRTIATPCVVNAAGPHAGGVGKLAGIDVPVVPLRRCIWTTHPFAGAPERFTMVIDFATGFYFHREGQGVLFGMGNRDEPPTFDLTVDEAFFESVVLETGTRRFPALADAAINAAWAGSYETSPDANPILGRVPGLGGFLLANGFSGHGFQHAPGVGQLIAEEIVDGAASTLDIAPFSIERFAHGDSPVEYGVV